jgi:hypothetical protein
MSSFGLPSAPGAPVLKAARAEASRRNGAKSKGPKTPQGKARSARNALKHGLRAEKFVILGDEDLAAFDALQAALMAELAPQGALQAVLARRIVAATWRLERAERMEAELFARNLWGTTSFGLALIRDSHGPRASTPCCAIAAGRWPSCGGRCALSRRSRPRRRPRRRHTKRPRRLLSPRRRRLPSRRDRTNPSAARILAIRTGRDIRSGTPRRVRPLPGRPSRLGRA